jgi:hypothetical protein
MRQVASEAIVDENKVRLEWAKRMVAEGEPLVAGAAEQAKAAEERRRRIEAGENVALPGKRATLKELGITPAEIRYGRALAALTEEQVKRYLDFHVGRPSDRRRRAYGKLRRFLKKEARRRAP